MEGTTVHAEETIFAKTFWQKELWSSPWLMLPTPAGSTNGDRWPRFIADSNGPASMTPKNKRTARKCWKWTDKGRPMLGLKIIFKSSWTFQNFKLLSHIDLENGSNCSVANRVELEQSKIRDSKKAIVELRDYGDNEGRHSPVELLNTRRESSLHYLIPLPI